MFISHFSTCFLMGPLNQLKKMFAKTRIIATILVLVSALYKITVICKKITVIYWFICIRIMKYKLRILQKFQNTCMSYYCDNRYKCYIFFIFVCTSCYITFDDIYLILDYFLGDVCPNISLCFCSKYKLTNNQTYLTRTI